MLLKFKLIAFAVFMLSFCQKGTLFSDFYRKRTIFRFQNCLFTFYTKYPQQSSVSKCHTIASINIENSHTYKISGANSQRIPLQFVKKHCFITHCHDCSLFCLYTFEKISFTKKTKKRQNLLIFTYTFHFRFEQNI